MNDQDTSRSGGLGPVTKIIASYVGNHTLSADQLSALIVSVDQAIRHLGTPISTAAATYAGSTDKALGAT